MGTKNIVTASQMVVGQIAKAGHWGFGWELLKVVAVTTNGYTVVQVDVCGFEVR